MKYHKIISVIAVVSVAGFSAFLIIAGRGTSNDVPKVEPAAQIVSAQPSEAVQQEKTDTQVKDSTWDDLLSSVDVPKEQESDLDVEMNYAPEDSVLADIDDTSSDYYIPENAASNSTTSSSSGSSASTAAASGASGGSSGGGDILSGGGLSGSSSSSSSSSSSDIADSDSSASEATVVIDSVSPTTSTSSPTGGGIASFEGVSVRALLGTERLLREDLSAPGEAEANLFCAKNETVSFQLIVTNKSNYSLRDVEIYVSDWQGSGSNKPEVSLYREHYIKISESSDDLDSEIGWYPDALIPFVDPYTGREITSGLYRANHATVNTRQNQGYWVDVRVDPDVSSGNYTCSILVTSSDRKVAEIPVNLKVWNFELPAERRFITWWYGFYNIHQYYGLSSKSGPSYATLLERYTDMAHEHGIYPENHSRKYAYTRPEAATIQKPAGTVTYYSSYHTEMRDFLSQYGKGVLQISPNWIIKQSGSTIQPTLASATKTLECYNDLSIAHPEYGTYVFYYDEPYTEAQKSELKSIRQIMDGINNLRVKMVVTGTSDTGFLKDSNDDICADIWICYASYMEEHPEQYGSLSEVAADFLAEDDGNVLWASGKHAYLDGSLCPYRNFSWRNYTIGATGGFGWHLAVSYRWSYLDDPNQDLWITGGRYVNNGKLKNGYCCLIYPGDSNRVGLSGDGGPIATIRLKTWRRACQDYEYFKILEDLTDKATVDEIISAVVQKYDDDVAPDGYEAGRQKIAQLILAKQ